MNTCRMPSSLVFASMRHTTSSVATSDTTAGGAAGAGAGAPAAGSASSLAVSMMSATWSSLQSATAPMAVPVTQYPACTSTSKLRKGSPTRPGIARRLRVESTVRLREEGEEEEEDDGEDDIATGGRAGEAAAVGGEEKRTVLTRRRQRECQSNEMRSASAPVSSPVSALRRCVEWRGWLLSALSEHTSGAPPREARRQPTRHRLEARAKGRRTAHTTERGRRRTGTEKAPGLLTEHRQDNANHRSEAGKEETQTKTM